MNFELKIQICSLTECIIIQIAVDSIELFIGCRMMDLEEWVPFTRAQGGRSARFGNYPRQFHINYIIKGKKLLGNELMATFDLTGCFMGAVFITRCLLTNSGIQKRLWLLFVLH